MRESLSVRVWPAVRSGRSENCCGHKRGDCHVSAISRGSSWKINLVNDAVIAVGDTQHQKWEIFVPIVKFELTQAEQEVRSKKSARVKKVWKQSGYDTVVKRFRDSNDLKFIECMMSALRNLDAQIIKELVEFDGEVTGDTVRSCVLENLACWDEHLGIMARTLQASSSLAWEEFDKLDSLNPEMD